MSPDEFFPALTSTCYRLTSAVDDKYTCVAWAFGFTHKWWWPSPDGESFWPSHIPNIESIAAFEALFSSLGFSHSLDESLIPSVEKIALFADIDDVPSHVARQLRNGKWTSKLGELEDIEHELHSLEGSEYGKVVGVYQRPTPP